MASGKIVPDEQLVNIDDNLRLGDNMTIYYVMIEGVPKETNPESEETQGAYIDVWVKTESLEDAIQKAKDYVDHEEWEVDHIEESAEVLREDYIDDPDLLECYDEACEKGISAIFYTWDQEEE